MIFSKLNFIVPINSGDLTLKIKNTSGAIVYIIKEPTCSIKQNTKFLSIKQSAESTLITLEFASNTEATEAHVLLRNALDILLGSTSPTPTPPPIPTIPAHVSKDYKVANPTIPTTYNGEQISGISPISYDVVGGTFISVEVNGVPVLVGNGCTPATFIAPQSHVVFAKKFNTFTNTSNTITLTSPVCDFAFGDSVIIIDNGIPLCTTVSAVVGNTITVPVTLVGPVTFVARPKKWGNISKGDIPLWFGGFAKYELAVNDTIVYKYITN